MHIEKPKCKLSVTALHTISIVEKKKKIASKIPERDRNAYQISKRDTQKEMDQRATFIFQFYFF